MAEVLAAHGYEEPRFETADSRAGRLNRLRLVDDGHEILITRCGPEMRADADHDLFTGEPVATASLEALRRQLEDRGENAPW